MAQRYNSEPPPLGDMPNVLRWLNTQFKRLSGAINGIARGDFAGETITVAGVVVTSSLRLGDTVLARFGGTTASYPALRNNGAVLLVRLADDSAYAAILASEYQVGGVKVVGAQQAANADTSGATLGQLETEVNELKAALRAHGLIAT